MIRFINKNLPQLNVKQVRALTKFELSLMNSSMAFYGYMITTTTACPMLGFGMFFGNSLMAMASQSMGQIEEIAEDSKMDRTKNRPLPAGELSPKYATKVRNGLFLTANASFLLFGLSYPAILLSNLTYATYYGYVKMKLRSKLNTTFGAVVGTLPIMIGIVQNVPEFYYSVDLLCNASYLFFWQFLHFYSILIMYKEQYQKTNFKMEYNKNNIAMISFMSGMAMMGGSFLMAYNTTIPLFKICMTTTGLFHLPLFYQIYNCWVNPGMQSAKQMKMFSYKLFFVFFFFSYLLMHNKERSKRQIEDKK